MSGEVEVPKTPDWLKSLEEKREKRLKARLGHEAGAGAPCLKCGDKCPGLDLHFWRKNCKICRCSKEDHDTHDDDIYSWAQFELLGSKPNKIKTKIVLPGRKDEVELEWAPKGQKDTIDKYLKTLPPEQIPVKGSQAAQERKQALQKQIPIHDIDPSLCHELNEDEVGKMNEYIAHVKNNSVGVGQIVNLSNVIKANLHNISPHEAHIIASRYSKGIPYTEIVKIQADFAKKLEKLCLNESKHKNLPNMQPQAGFDNKESLQQPITGSKIRDLNYQHYPDSNEKNRFLNTQFAQGLHPKQQNTDQVPFDYNLDNKLLQDTNFDPSKTPSQFKGYHTPGYKPRPPNNDPAEEYFDDVNNVLQNTAAINQVAYGKNVQNPNALHSGNIVPNSGSLPYNQIREGFRPCGVEHQINSNVPNYPQPLTKNMAADNQREGYKPCGVTHGPHPSNLYKTGLSDSTNQNSNVGKYLENLPYKDCGVDHQNVPYNTVLDKYNPAQCSTENNPGQLPQYAQNLGDADAYGFENPLFKNNQQNREEILYANVKPLKSGTEDLTNPIIAPKNMQDLIHSTYDPSKPKDSNRILSGDIRTPSDNTNVPFDPNVIGNINTQHGSLGYVPGANTGQIPSGVSLKHPLLDKYGNVDSNPAYTGEMGTSGQEKVNNLRNRFENPGVGQTNDQRVPYNDPTLQEYSRQPRKQLPEMQPGRINVSEDFVNPNQVNIGAIRDINYPDNEIREAMIATNPDDDFYGEDYSPDSIKEILNNIILPNCHYCKKPFEENEFAVTIDRANVLFHASCFKCAGCNQSLADNIYFYHKESNNVYCGRDYAKIKGYPRCKACDELIFTKEYCLAENATFHLKHFCCFQCDTPLAGKEYTLEDEQPYCLPCFEMTKASKCSTCQNVIKPDERGCNLNGVHFHAEDDCFACIVCKKPLMGQKLLLRNEKLYCSHDCFNLME